MKPFKLIVAGSRKFKDFDFFTKELLAFLQENFTGKEIEFLSGMAEGPDEMAIQFAKIYKIPYKEYPANWQDFGRSAGFIRNAQMGREAQGLIAFWDGRSPGTANMIDFMSKALKPIKIIKVKCD